MAMVGGAVHRAALLLVFIHVAAFILFNEIAFTRASSSRAAHNDNDRHEHYEIHPMSINAKIQMILDEILEWQRESTLHHHHQQQQRHRPFVTAAFAQSLDGKLAVYEEEEEHSVSTTTRTATTTTTTSSSSSSSNITTSSNYPLSGDESLLLTHALRSIHDGILVGSRTLSIDNPRLSNRLWKTKDSVSHHQQKQPRPILLDTNLEHISKLLLKQTTEQQQNFLRCLPNRPVVCCSHAAAAAATGNGTETVKNNKTNLPSTLSSLILDGTIQLLPCDCTTGSDSQERQQLCLQDVLRRLKERHNIQTLMVEGGATLLSSLFAGQHINYKESNDSNDPSSTTLVDALCVTIAPKILGWGIAPTFVCASGTGNDTAIETSASSTVVVDLNPLSPRFVTLGQDTTLLSRWPQKRGKV